MKRKIIIKEKESDIVKAILDYLYYKHIIVWRNQSGVIFTNYKEKRHAIKMGKKGISDIIGIFPDGSGRIMCLEVKTKIGKPTQEQTDFLNDVREAGGVAEIVRSIDDVQNVLYKNK